VRMRLVSYLLRGMVDRTGDNVATLLRILNLSREGAHHSAHNVTHVQDIIVDYLQVHFRFICVLPKSNTGVLDEVFLSVDCESRTSSCAWALAYK
jgi:hypothetical protein